MNVFIAAIIFAVGVLIGLFIGAALAASKISDLQAENFNLRKELNSCKGSAKL